MTLSRSLCSILVALLVLPLSSGYSIDTYEAVYTMHKVSVSVEAAIGFNESITDQLLFGLPPASDVVLVEIDGVKMDHSGEETVELNLSKARSVTLLYTTDFYLDKDDFLLDFKAPLPINKLALRLILPEDGRLEEPLAAGREGSIYPKPEMALTDGQKLIFIWERANLTQGEGLAIYAKIEKQKRVIWPWIIAIVAILGVVVLILLRKKTPENPAVTDHLKEDEAQIVRILRQRQDNQIEQGTLRVITGMSKAALSRLLSELEHRKVIHKENRGKKNLIFLRK